MTTPAINIKTDGNKVVVTMDTNHGFTINFDRAEGHGLAARLLAAHLNDRISRIMERERKKAYDIGYKQGRAKAKKCNWFPSCMDTSGWEWWR